VCSSDLFGNSISNSTGLLIRAGTEANPLLTKTAGRNAISLYGKSTATSGDFRTIYSYAGIAGAGGSGAAVRSKTVVLGVTASAPYGADAGAYVDATDQVSAEMIALRGVLGATAHATSRSIGGWCAALCLLSDVGANNTWANASYIRISNAQGSDARPLTNFIDFSSTGCMVAATTSTIAGAIRCKISGTATGTIYIPYGTAVS
jgi:hypothetical protein